MLKPSVKSRSHDDDSQQNGPRHRPARVNATIGLLAFLGISAMAGGLALALGTKANGTLPPAEWLDAILVVESWLVPGLVLGIGFGLGALLTMYGVLRQPCWHWLWSIERRTRHHWHGWP